MNKTISKIGAALVTVTVFLFAVCMLVDFLFGSYLVCMGLPLGFVLMTAGFYQQSPKERSVAALAGLVLAGIYATLIFLVYFAQTTSVRTEELNSQAARVLDYRQGGLLFNYDLLGYGMMALSTFFTGLSMVPESKSDKWLKALMMIHGAFLPGCFVMPMTGVFTAMAEGDGGEGGTVALLVWCAYFLPVGVLAYRHFQKERGDLA